MESGGVFVLKGKRVYGKLFEQTSQPIGITPRVSKAFSSGLLMQMRFSISITELVKRRLAFIREMSPERSATNVATTVLAKDRMISRIFLEVGEGMRLHRALHHSIKIVIMPMKSSSSELFSKLLIGSDIGHPS